MNHDHHAKKHGRHAVITAWSWLYFAMIMARPWQGSHVFPAQGEATIFHDMLHLKYSAGFSCFFLPTRESEIVCHKSAWHFILPSFRCSSLSHIGTKIPSHQLQWLLVKLYEFFFMHNRSHVNRSSFHELLHIICCGNCDRWTMTHQSVIFWHFFLHVKGWRSFPLNFL